MAAKDTAVPSLITRDDVAALARSRVIAITDDATYKRATEIRAEADAARRWWADEHEDSRKKTRAAWQSVIDLINKYVKPLDKLIDAQDREIVRWRKVKEAQRQAAIAAQAPAREAAREAYQRTVVEQQMELADQRELAGDHAGAIEVLEAPIPEAPDFDFDETYIPPGAAALETDAPVDFRKHWHAEVTDLGRLMLAAAATVARERGWVLSYRKRDNGSAAAVELHDLVAEVPVECFEVNEKFLNAQARFYKAAMQDKFPGVKAVEAEKPVKARE